jgi:hypothetical protein
MSLNSYFARVYGTGDHLVMRLLSLALASLLGGCIANGLDTNESSQNVITSNFFSFFRLAGNHLHASALANEQATASTAQITTDGYLLSSAADGLLTNPDGSENTDGEEVLGYIVSCALPSGTTLYDSRGNTYLGQIGLAASWIDHPMTLDQQRWVSSCLYARVNGLDQAVTISLRAAHPQFFATSSSEAAEFTKQEGAFYGQYFDPAGMKAFACSGADVYAAAPDFRICAQPGDGVTTPCGFSYTGQCDGDGPRKKSGAACSGFVGQGYFSTCYGESAGPHTIGTSHGASDSYSEVITVYVK